MDSSDSSSELFLGKLLIPELLFLDYHWNRSKTIKLLKRVNSTANVKHVWSFDERFFTLFWFYLYWNFEAVWTGVFKKRSYLFFRTDSFIFVCRIEICHGDYVKDWGRLSTFSINSVLPIHYLFPLIANNFHANMARTPLCMSLHFCIYFHLCFINQVISAQSVLATIMPPLEKPFLFMPALALVCK